MGKELELLKPLLFDCQEKKTEHSSFYVGTIGVHNVVLMQCGIGKVNAAVGTLTLINQYHPDLVINSGVAGGANEDVDTMDVIVGERVAYHDVWCGPESPWGAVQGLPLYYEGDQELLRLLPADNRVKPGLICSGDRFIDSLEEVNSIRARFPEVLAVDMESGSISQVCHLRGVRFLSFRVISDSPCSHSDNSAQYENFWEAAPRRTFDLLKQLLIKLPK